MKHNLKVTILLLVLFLASHIIGLFLVDITNPVTTITLDDGSTDVIRDTVSTPGVGNLEPINHAYVPIAVGVLLGTFIALLLIKFNKFGIMKVWHVLGITLCLYISLYNLAKYFFGSYNSEILVLSSLIVSGALSFFRTFKKNIYAHNISELFIYGGIAVMFSVIFKTPDLKSASIMYVSILLIIISLYDMFAVWQSKHMIKLANAQTSTNAFAGLYIPYGAKKDDSKKIKKSTFAKKSQMKKVVVEQKTAILGGGDIAFTLLFSSVVLLNYSSLFKGILVSSITTLSLAGLFLFAKRDKFYPAMPFLSAGCFVGLFIVNLL